MRIDEVDSGDRAGEGDVLGAVETAETMMGKRSGRYTERRGHRETCGQASSGDR